MAGSVRTIYSDAAKQNAVFPRTKISGITDSQNNSLQSILDDKLNYSSLVPGKGISIDDDSSGGLIISSTGGGGNYTTVQLGTTWTGTAPSLQQTVQVTSITSSDNPELSVITTNASTFDAACNDWSKVWNAETGAGTITFYAYEETNASITVAVKW